MEVSCILKPLIQKLYILDPLCKFGFVVLPLTGLYEICERLVRRTEIGSQYFSSFYP